MHPTPNRVMPQAHPDQWFGCFSYSQHGEDLVILNVFYALGITRPTYLDIGAHHPINISNTALLYSRGSRGINVEANPNLIRTFHTLRPDDVTLNVGVSDTCGTMTFYMIDKFSGRNTFDKHAADMFVRENPQFSITETMEIPVTTLNTIVDRYAAGVFPAFLNIDVEGWDDRILRSADFRSSSPCVICVEALSAGEDKIDAIADVLEPADYSPYCKMGANMIFVRRAFKKALLGRFK